MFRLRNSLNCGLGFCVRKIGKGETFLKKSDKQTLTGWVITIGIQTFRVKLMAHCNAKFFEEVKSRPEYIIVNKVNF